MPDDILYEKLLASSYRFVSFRPRSEKEFRDFLTQKLKKRKVYDIRVIPRVLQRMTELGYVNDKAFARWWVDSRMRFRPKGDRVIMGELLQKGIAKALIQEAIDEARAESPESEKEAVLALAEKQLTKWGILPAREQKKKLYDYLGRRGFDGEMIATVVDELVAIGYNEKQ